MSLLDWISFFDNLTYLEKDNLSMFCQERFIKSWEILFQEWDIATALYIVKKWKLIAYRKIIEWDKTLGYIEAWEFVWEMAFFDRENTPKKRMASVKALEDTILIVIMNYSITDLATKRKDIYDKIDNIIKERKLKNARI